MTTQRIKDLAEEMNVSEADVLMFAQSMANGIERDKAARAFMDGNTQTQAELVNAYAADSVKKIISFHSKILTNPEANKVFCLSVYNKIKQSQEDK